MRFYNVQNENSNEISIPPMKLEHLALVLYIGGGGFDMTSGHILLLMRFLKKVFLQVQ